MDLERLRANAAGQSISLDPNPLGEYIRALLAAAPQMIAAAREAGRVWMPIDTAPKNGTEVDIWVTGPGARRISDCRWGKPSRDVNWMSGCQMDSSPQWITRSGCGLDPRNGKPTHWMPLPPPPAEVQPHGE
jgi:hypothetical protein